MPNHVYQPKHSPPTWVDRLLVHPMETTVIAASVFFGSIVALSMFVSEFVPSASMDKMPFIVVMLVAIFLIAGGVLSLVGLHWAGVEVTKGWAIERFGWLLSFGGFGAFAASVSWHYPNSFFSWGIPFILCLGCLLRIWSIARIERAMRLTLAAKELAE